MGKVARESSSSSVSAETKLVSPVLTRSVGTLRDACNSVSTYWALSFWVFGLLFNGLGFVLAVVSIPRLWAVLFIAAQLALLAIPLDVPCPHWASSLIAYSFKRYMRYFPTRLVFEDESSFQKGERYVFAYEPHSVLPMGIFVFSHLAGVMPPALTRVRVLASDAGFWSPIMRNFWWWAGIRPVSKRVMQSLLSRGTSVVLCPGGVRECLYLNKKGKEALYLSGRSGFVKVALEAGAPLVPVFAFGQTQQYSCWRPFIDWPKGLIPFGTWAKIARRMGYLPLFMWGQFGSPLPRRTPLTIVVGRPIPVPKVDNPTEEQAAEYLQRYISALETLFELHRAEAGFKETDLIIH